MMACADLVALFALIVLYLANLGVLPTAQTARDAICKVNIFKNTKYCTQNGLMVYKKQNLHNFKLFLFSRRVLCWSRTQRTASRCGVGCACPRCAIWPRAVRFAILRCGVFPALPSV